jgi:hypothetical protein
MTGEGESARRANQLKAVQPGLQKYSASRCGDVLVCFFIIRTRGRGNANTYFTAVIPGRASFFGRARNPHSRWWLWIPGLRQAAHPGMTVFGYLKIESSPDALRCIRAMARDAQAPVTAAADPRIAVIRCQLRCRRQSKSGLKARRSAQIISPGVGPGRSKAPPGPEVTSWTSWLSLPSSPFSPSSLS